MSKIVQSKLPCPDTKTCGSSDAYVTYDDGHGYCFSCGKDFQPGKDLSSPAGASFQYVPWRGVTEATMRHYGVLTKVDSEGRPVEIGFPYPDSGLKVRGFATKSFTTPRSTSSAPIFGMDKFTQGSARAVTITEGELDALSAFQLLGSKYPVVSVRGASSARKDCVVARDFLNSFEKIYLCFDNDRAGQEALKEVAPLFDFNKVFHVKLTRKDANEYLEANDGEAFRRAWWNAQRFLPEGIHSRFAELDGFIDEAVGQGVPFPFPSWNDSTYGLRFGESFLIKAPEKVGKSLVMKRLIKHFLETTDLNIGSIALEEGKGQHLKSLAGLKLGAPVHLPDAGVSNDDIKAAIRSLVSRDDRFHIYNHFGSDDLNVLIDTIRFMVAACGCRIIFFDHISMAVSGLEGDDERRKLDWLATHLQMLVEELNFALVFISHVNDAGQTRGSRYITKVADTTVALSRNIVTPDPVLRNTINVLFEFNRFTGRTGPVEPLIFDPDAYSLEERGVLPNEQRKQLPTETRQAESDTAESGVVEHVHAEGAATAPAAGQEGLPH